MAAIQGTHWLVIDTFGSHSPPKHNNAPGTAADKKYVQIIFQLRSIVVHGATEQRTTENVIKNYFPGLWFSVPRVRVEPRNSVNPLMGIVCVCSSVAVCWCRVRKPSVLLNCCYTLVTGHGLGSCRRDHWPVWEHFLRHRPSMQTYLYSIYFINIPRIIFVPFSSFFTATTGPIFIDKWRSDVDI